MTPPRVTPRPLARCARLRNLLVGSLLLASLLAPGLGQAETASSGADGAVVVTDADVAAHLFAPIATPLEMAGPRMRGDGYNSDYLFGMSRAIGNSTLEPAVKPLFWLITVPLDIVFLPFAAIGGFFA